MLLLDSFAEVARLAGSATASEQLPWRGRVLASLCAGGALGGAVLAGAAEADRAARLSGT
jgi:hypothetical protein